MFQWLFDEAQMRADSVGAPVTPQQWDYIHEMGAALRNSLDDVTAVFAPSCIGHAVLTKRDWLNIKIDDISLAEALKSWETFTARKRNKMFKRSSKVRRLHNNSSSIDRGSRRICRKSKHHDKKNRNKKKQAQQERHKSAKERRHQRLDGDGRRKMDATKSATTAATTTSGTVAVNIQRFDNFSRAPLTSDVKIATSSSNKSLSFAIQHLDSKSKRQRHNGKSNNQRHKKGEPFTFESSRCHLRLLERCSWPQCNHSCPSLTNPLTGEELKFLELLASFGLDIKGVATALGVDMQTLNNMDHAVLVNLLTQTSS